MIKRRKHVATEVVAPEQVAPEQVATPTVEATPATEPVAATEPKAKKVRYAPTSVLVDTAVITRVTPNPKRPGSKSFDRYAKFYRVGVSVAQLVQEYKDSNLSGMLARNDLRWDVQHGQIELGQPQSE
jgi:cell division septation protein DedD